MQPRASSIRLVGSGTALRRRIWPPAASSRTVISQLAGPGRSPLSERPKMSIVPLAVKTSKKSLICGVKPTFMV